MTREELRDQVVNIISRTDKTSLINSALDMALEEISMRHYFQDMFSQSNITTVDGTETVSLPSNTHKVLEARLINDAQSYTIDLRPKKWVTDRFPNPSADSEGKPEFAYQSGSNIHFVPTPDDAYTVTVTVLKRMAALATDAASPEVDGIDRVIIAYAAHWVFDALEQYESAAKWLQKFEWMLAKAIVDDERRLGERRIFSGFSPTYAIYPADYTNDPFFKMPRY